MRKVAQKRGPVWRRQRPRPWANFNTQINSVGSVRAGSRFDADPQVEGRRSRVRGRSLVRGAVSPFRQSPTAGLLCWLGANPVAERVCCARAGRLESRKCPCPNNHDPAQLVVAATSAAVGPDVVVPRASRGSRRTKSPRFDRSVSTQTSCRALEVRHHRPRAGGRGRHRVDLDQLKQSPSAAPDQLRRIQVDGPDNHLAGKLAVLKSGTVLLSLTAESGKLVQPGRSAVDRRRNRDPLYLGPRA